MDGSPCVILRLRVCVCACVCVCVFTRERESLRVRVGWVCLSERESKRESAKIHFDNVKRAGSVTQSLSLSDVQEITGCSSGVKLCPDFLTQILSFESRASQGVHF